VAVLAAPGAPVLAGLGDELAHGAHVAAGHRRLRLPQRQHAGAQLVEPAPRRRFTELATRPRTHLAMRRDDGEEVVQRPALQHAVAHLAGELSGVQQRPLTFVARHEVLERRRTLDRSLRLQPLVAVAACIGQRPVGPIHSSSTAPRQHVQLRDGADAPAARQALRQGVGQRLQQGHREVALICVEQLVMKASDEAQ